MKPLKGEITKVEIIVDQDILHTWCIEELECQIQDLEEEKEYAETGSYDWYQVDQALDAAQGVLQIKLAQVHATDAEDYIECLLYAGWID